MHFNGKLTPELKAIIDFFCNQFMSKKDPNVYNHSRRVSAMAFQIARKLRLPNDQCEEIRLAGLLHDVGKLMLAEGVLQKTSYLSREEMEVVRTHPKEGFYLLRRCTQNKTILSAVSEHHERIDGSGYPNNIKNPSICGQIIGVADYFTARQEPRVYRPTRLTMAESYDATMVQPFTSDVLTSFQQVYIAACKSTTGNINSLRVKRR